MTNTMKSFFAELVKSTTFATKVSMVRSTLDNWLNEQVYPDSHFFDKLRNVFRMFIAHQIDRQLIYNLVGTVDSSKKLTEKQIDYLVCAFLTNRKVVSVVQTFVDGYRLSGEDISALSNFLVTQMNEVYQL
ncbi:hypothetical protein [Condylorrhiza vestigialis mutiple nucleopolyhedrovirus]|uniref:Ac75 n=1 Tax=Condylorrhiza vestigialis mutiple nucleopolyhedrovirus TaxID=1592576 RepID=A0A0B4UL54_9ABAC|nr:hypothetical protein [Condylorrhiza vestigialis mutiple nucleopolyhedrovirus]AJD09237.1 hypothetical protein [Condylorrhiza vestigialis mutiple nucleopolyhedrovirus]